MTYRIEFEEVNGSDSGSVMKAKSFTVTEGGDFADYTITAVREDGITQTFTGYELTNVERIIE